MLAFMAVGLGVVIGGAAGGNPKNLSRPWLRHEWLVILLFVAQGLARGRLTSSLPATDAALSIWVLSSIALGIVLLGSLARPGVPLSILALLLNVLVVLLNSAMPVLGVGGQSSEMVKTRGFYTVLNEATIAGFASDVMPLGFAGHSYLLSIGDVALFVSVIAVLSAGMLSAVSHGDA